MKKKYLSIILAAAVSLSLAACGTVNDGAKAGEGKVAALGKIEDGYDETKNYTGIKIDGFKTELSIYNNYDNVKPSEDFQDKILEYAIDYVKNAGYPDADENDFSIEPYRKNVIPYTGLTNDWKAIAGKGYAYWVRLPKDKYGDDFDVSMFVCDPMTGQMFRSDDGITKIKKQVKKEYANGLIAEIEMYPWSWNLGYADEDMNTEHYIDCIAEFKYVTGSGKLTISTKVCEEKDKVEEFFELVGQYGEVEKEDPNCISHDHFCNFRTP